MYRIRTFIIESMRHFGFEFEEEKELTPKPNWENRIKNNGAIGLVCLENGLPISLMTPWGEIRLVDTDKKNGGFIKRILKARAEEKFVQEMKKPSDSRKWLLSTA